MQSAAASEPLIRLRGVGKVYETGTQTVVGLTDVVVVDMPDVLLVCARDCAQEVRKVVARLQELGRADLT